MFISGAGGALRQGNQFQNDSLHHIATNDAVYRGRGRDRVVGYSIWCEWLRLGICIHSQNYQEMEMMMRGPCDTCKEALHTLAHTKINAPIVLTHHATSTQLLPKLVNSSSVVTA